MGLRSILSCSFLSLILLTACDDKKDGYSGLADLVAERNEARQSISEKTVRKKNLERQDAKDTLKKDALKEDTAIVRPLKKEKISSVVLYEKKIEVVDSSSRMAIAKGIAYLNKEGQIVKIKILKE
ncbi:MAG: hypothetical protein KKF12_15000 [Proteobacteria bacterium]|nr:hypothetical protein [Desulfobacula sp.]MBU3952330.1 hypothetical protein [Pseudomonadota bacterium]MBU4132120.1 hypothetical protein [Pseudomonadota bacterium]